MPPDPMHALLTAAADAILPPANESLGDPLPGAAELDVATRVLALIRRLPPVHQRLLRAGLWLLEHLPWLALQPRFSRLDRPARARWLHRLEAFSPLSARALLPLKMLTMGAYLETPRVAALLGMENGQKVPLAQALAPIQPLPVQRPEDLPPDVRAEFDVVIVGSGAGAAPLARTLAQAGWSVALIEEGDAHTREEFRAPPLDRMPLLYRDAGATVTLGREMDEPLNSAECPAELKRWVARHKAQDGTRCVVCECLGTWTWRNNDCRASPATSRTSRACRPSRPPSTTSSAR